MVKHTYKVCSLNPQNSTDKLQNDCELNKHNLISPIHLKLAINVKIDAKYLAKCFE